MEMAVAAQALSASMENYLEAIFLLIRDHTVARSKDIADRLAVSPSSVTGALQALRERGLVHYEPYGFVTLTDAGAEIAGRVARRHTVLRDFMVTVLSIEKTEADAAACRMEHGISKPVVDRFVEFAEFVATCPRAGAKWVHGFRRRCGDGALAPEDCERCIAECLSEVKAASRKGESGTMSLPLSALKPGEKGQIERMAGSGPVKRRIRDMGVTTGSLVEVVRLAPLGDPIDVKVKGYHLSLRKDEAKDIIVKRVAS
jgi:DtxR family transcriptional regulator, Mn-dependent transcriptional regulator